MSPLAVLVAFGSAGAQAPATQPTASATAWAIQIALPNAAPVTTPSAIAPPASQPAVGGAYVYPQDGSVVSAQSTTASATTTIARNAAAGAESVVTGISLFAGAVTADAVTARASAGTGPSGAGGNANGSVVTNLVVGGQPVPPGGKAAVADWGVLSIGTETIDRAAGNGVRGYHGIVSEVELRLTADHGGR